MTIPYTYLLVCPDGRKYYGVRFAKDCSPSDFWVSYFTSSKEVKELLKTSSKDQFSFQIRRTFATGKAARNWEHKVLRRLNVRENEFWINKTDGISIPPMPGDSNPSKREDVRQKISARATGRKRPDVSERLKNVPRSVECRSRISKTRKKLFQDGDLTAKKGEKRPEISGANHFRFGKTYAPLANMNSQEHTCPHCKKIGKGPGMKRYHFDNCKAKNQIS